MSEQLVDPPTRIDVEVGRARRPYRIWFGQGQILAIDCPVHVSMPFEYRRGLQDRDGSIPEIILPVAHWRTFWRAGINQPQGRRAKSAIRECKKILERSLSL